MSETCPKCGGVVQLLPGSCQHDSTCTHACPECGWHYASDGPINWPARFRTAADVAEEIRGFTAEMKLRELAVVLDAYLPDAREAIGRALLGEGER